MPPLDSALAQDCAALLVPLCATTSERLALLSSAFSDQPALYRGLEVEGDALSFCRRLVPTLHERGCLAGGEHPVARLLALAQEQYGVEKAQQAARLIAQLNALCVAAPVTALPPIPSASARSSQGSPALFESQAAEWAERVLWLLFGLVVLGVLALLGAIYWWGWGTMEPITYAVGILTGVAALGYTIAFKEPPSPDNLLHRLTRYRQRQLARQHHVTLPDDGTPPRTQREAERRFLDARERAIAEMTRSYIDQAGEGDQVEMAQEFEVEVDLPEEMRPLHDEAREEDRRAAPRKKTSFTSVLKAVRDMPRTAILGDPGGGKTAALRKIELDAIGRVLADRKAPIPIYLPLREWLSEEQSFEQFLADKVPLLAPYLPQLWQEKRLMLLLDGLNELPAAQQLAKATQIQRLIHEQKLPTILLTCRKQDYPYKALTLDRLLINPLDPLRIREFICRRMMDPTPKHRSQARCAAGDALFWTIAGSGAQEAERDFVAWYPRARNRVTAWIPTVRRRVRHEARRLFWTGKALPDGLQWGGRYSNQWDRWLEERDAPDGLLALARNPYLLLMLVGQARGGGKLPDNRAALFDRFVELLLLRESDHPHATRLAEQQPDKRIVVLPVGRQLLSALGRLAYQMQLYRAAGGTERNAVVALPSNEATQLLGAEAETWLRLGRATTILSDEATVSFSHQLLQEYFAAVQMREEIKAGRLQAKQLWPTPWQRTGWEEATVLLAGLDAELAVRWSAEANPEVAADCVARSGETIREESKQWLRELWLPRLTDIQREPHPYARAAVGRALATVTLDRRMLDDRPGVGVRADGVPDIAWVRMEGGDFPIGGDEKAYSPLPVQRVTLPAFDIAKYPVTNAQWDAFQSAADGYANAAWWQGMAEGKQQPAEPSWREGNHPRETVNWYEAVAFCRWLSSRLGHEVRLPTEIEWERAARGKEGRIMPWGGKGPESGYANSDETYGEKVGPYYLRRTSPVGIYPHGATPEGLHEIAGNIWEWTSTEWAENGGGSDNIMSSAARVLRGGSWYDYPQFARTCSRYDWFPQARGGDGGFRLVGPAVVTL